MAFLAVMTDVTGFVSGNYCRAAFASWFQVMVIEFIGSNAPIAEVTIHSGPFLYCGICGFEVTAIQARELAGFKKTKRVDGAATYSAFKECLLRQRILRCLWIHALLSLPESIIGIISGFLVSDNLTGGRICI